jgi:hypothetical protein
MKPSRALATLITGKVLDKIEQTRTLNSDQIEAAAWEALLVASADDDEASQSAETDGPVRNAAIALVKFALANPEIIKKIDQTICIYMNELYHTLLDTGWKP